MTTPNTTCLYPQFAPSTGYNKGCRCERCIEGRRAVNNKFREKNPGYRKTKIAAWKKNNRKKINLKTQQWLQTPSNTIKANINSARCRVIRVSGLGSVPPLTPDEQVREYEIYKTRYYLTESTGVMHHVDHIVPITKGGQHHPDNLQVLTATENRKKMDKIV